MEFSENGVYIIGAIMGLLLSIPLIWLMGRSSLSYLNRNDVNVKITRKSYFAFLLIIPIFYGFSIFFHYANVISLIAVGMVMEGFGLYLYLKYLNRVRNKKDNSVDDERPKLVYISFMTTWFVVVVVVGTIAATQWLMPDVVEITKDGQRFEAREMYVLPCTHGTRPGCSYINNMTPDSIYRVIVRYAYLGEELNNKYAVENVFAPGQFTRMHSRVNYAMKIIPPIMLPSYSRRGRYHTQLVFLTEANHLNEFKTLNMTEFGLKNNLIVDTIIPYRDKIVRMDSSLYNAYKVVNPNPYKHSN